MNIEVKNSVKPVDYVDAMKILEKRADDVFYGKKSELLWILEHKTVYTAGKTANAKDLIDKRQKVISTNRGGKYTVHSPGQKIVYFVLNLKNRGRDVKKLINKIEKCIIQILKEYNLESYSDAENIGIWINNEKKIEKIAAIGVRIKKWVAYHGFSLNINNDLSLYNKIVPCGIKDKGITNLNKIGVKNYKNINKIIKENFLSTFL